jgi:hypothetical protein
LGASSYTLWSKVDETADKWLRGRVLGRLFGSVALFRCPILTHESDIFSTSRETDFFTFGVLHVGDGRELEALFALGAGAACLSRWLSGSSFFTGILIMVPAAFVLAFGTRFRWLAIVTRLALGVGAGLILDEMSYLVMTPAGDADYVSSVSVLGAVAFVGAGLVLAFALYRWHQSKMVADVD